MKENDTVIRITNKGRAYLAAFEAGLIPKTENGYDDTKFKDFWDRFEANIDHCEYCPANQIDDQQHLSMYILAVVLSTMALIFSILQLLK